MAASARLRRCECCGVLPGPALPAGAAAAGRLGGGEAVPVRFMPMNHCLKNFPYEVI